MVLFFVIGQGTTVEIKEGAFLSCCCKVCEKSGEFTCAACEGDAGTVPSHRARLAQRYWVEKSDIMDDTAGLKFQNNWSEDYLAVIRVNR